MTGLTVGVIGAGAAGVSAVKTLRAHGVDIDIELFARNGETPHNRTLVNKGVAIGLLEPHQTNLPPIGVQTSAYTVRGIDPRIRRVHLDSGNNRAFDALIVATGSRPRPLDDTIVGRDQALSAGRLTTLHSLTDAIRVRDLLATADPARVLFLGGGLVASETASLLTDAGHNTVLIARSALPGASAIGDDAARQLLDLHRHHHAVHLGRDVCAIRTHADHITVVLDDDTKVEGDLAIVAHGTLPAAPAPWTGPGGIAVDNRLRTLSAPDQRIYAAGGVAVHHYPGRSSYRIDHWDDATAQGAHAAKTLLHDLGHGDDPGAYLPASTFSARIHGRTLTGAGHPALASYTRVISSEPLVVGHCLGDDLVALTGIDVTAAVRQWVSRLHAAHRSELSDAQAGRR
ncbi:FAD-dependent oxidoreductase [Microbacterium mcarthurae (nom. nud.)]|uniref:NAD(P)/FAD-dependent oxidoreductase n=1 Tax=Microbacterium mcarthurae TaxID=3035918 RepID=A0ABW9GIU2_9MICO